MMLRKQSLRISLPMFWLEMCTNMLFSEPDRPPNSTSTIIFSPSRQISIILPARTPSSTIWLMISGCKRSIITSPTMNSPPSTAKNRYCLTYFHMGDLSPCQRRPRKSSRPSVR